MFGSGDLGMGIRFVINDMATAVAARIGTSLRTLNNQVSSIATNIQSSAMRMQSGLFGVAMAIGLLVAPFTATIGAANKFEATMSEVYAKGGALDREELDRLRQTALEMKNLRMSNAQDRAEAMVEFAKGGFQGLQIERGLFPAMNLSASGDISMARAVEVVSNQMHQFNLASSDFQHIADVNVLAANKTSQSVNDMAQAMKFAGPNAHALGQSLEETAATIELMAQGGLRGTIAARAFYNALQRLSDPTPKMAEALKMVNIDPYSGPNRSFIGVTNLIQQLNQSLSGATGEQTAKVLTRMIGSDALKNINALMRTQIEIVRDGKIEYLRGADAIRYYTEMNMRASEGMGVAAETAAEMKNNLHGDIEELKNAFVNFKITVGEAFQQGLRPFMQAITKLMVELVAFAKTPFGQTVIRWAGALAAAAAAAIALGFAFTVILPAMMKMIIAGAPYIAVLTAIGYGLFNAINGMREFGEAALDADRNLMKPLTTWQRIGGFLAGMGEIWSSWNGKTFELSEDLHDKLKQSGDLENLLTTGTYLVRAKEFVKGFAAGATDFSPTIKAFKDLGDALLNLLGIFGFGDKASGTTNQWYAIGKTLRETFGETLKLTLNAIAFSLTTIIDSLTLFVALMKEITAMQGDFSKFSWDRVMSSISKPSDNAGVKPIDYNNQDQFMKDAKKALNTDPTGKNMSNDDLNKYLQLRKEKANGGNVNVNLKIEGDVEKFMKFVVDSANVEKARD